MRIETEIPPAISFPDRSNLMFFIIDWAGGTIGGINTQLPEIVYASNLLNNIRELKLKEKERIDKERAQTEAETAENRKRVSSKFEAVEAIMNAQKYSEAISEINTLIKEAQGYKFDDLIRKAEEQIQECKNGLERLEKEEKERQEKERLEKERLEKERFESERLEKERLEKERLERERLERERLAKIKSETIEFIEKSSVIYKEMEFQKIQDKTGIDLAKLEEIIANMIYDKQIRGQIHGNKILFEKNHTDVAFTVVR